MPNFCIFSIGAVRHSKNADTFNMLYGSVLNTNDRRLFLPIICKFLQITFELPASLMDFGDKIIEKRRRRFGRVAHMATISEHSKRSLRSVVSVLVSLRGFPICTVD